jgi:alpha-galactosidase
MSEKIIEQINDYEAISKGDMPGDQIKINELHIAKAKTIFPRLLELLNPILNSNSSEKAVVSVYGGSGVGKSEIGALLSHFLNAMNLKSYILSGDNYPHRIPRVNDAERLRVFQESGIKGLVSQREYREERNILLQELQKTGKDVDPNSLGDYPWLSAYQEAGVSGLKKYLGTSCEIDFDELNTIINQFKCGKKDIILKRMGRNETELWYDSIDFSHTKILIIEWTHGNNGELNGVDIPILLNSTPQETLEHRRLRNRDGGTDSSFTMTVLSIEQELLKSQASSARLIVAKNGDIISYEEYRKLMGVNL